MRKYKKGESVTVRMPDESEITGNPILRVSPDGKACVLRINDDVEMLICGKGVGCEANGSQPIFGGWLKPNRLRPSRETRFLRDESTANT